MRKKSKWMICIMAAVLTMTACGGSGGGSYAAAKSEAGAYEDNGYYEEPMEAAAEEAYDYESYGESTGAGMMLDRSSDEGDTASAPEEGTKMVASNKEVVLDAEKIVYYADISMSSIHFENALKEIREAGEKYGALIQSENFSEGDTSWYTTGSGVRNGRTYYVEYRVPAKNYRDFIDSTGNMDAVVDSRNTSAQNITQQYSDTKAEIESLEAEKKQLNEIMEQATKVSDVLEIQDRITSVQTRLNQDNSNIRRMDTDVTYSYVNINLREVRIYEEKVDPPELTFAERISKNFAASLTEVQEFFKGLVLFLVRNWLHLIILALIIFGVVLIIKRSSRKSAERRAERRKQMEQRQKEMQAMQPQNLSTPPGYPAQPDPSAVQNQPSPGAPAPGEKQDGQDKA